MKLHQIRCLDAVVRTGSVRRAATELGLTQPSVSEQIRSLEGAVGFALIERSTRGSRVTAAGAQLLPRLQRVLWAEAAAQAEAITIRDARTGSVRVAAVRGALDTLVPGALGPFAAAHPDVQTEVEELPTGPALDGLLDGRFDLAVVGHTDAQPRLPTPLVGAGLGAGPVTVVVPDRFLAGDVKGADRPVSWGDLVVADLPWIMLPPGNALRAISDRLLAGVEYRRACEVNDSLIARDFVRAGIGAALLPTGRTADLDDSVIRLTPEIPGPPLLVGLACVHDASRQLSPAAQALRAGIMSANRVEVRSGADAA